MQSFFMLISDVKDFMENEVNRLFVWVLILNLIIACWIHFEITGLKKYIDKQNENQKIEIQSVRKRIDYRYFNLTRTLEDLYGLKIDTQSGELKK